MSPDITMCHGTADWFKDEDKRATEEDCPIRNSCRRFKATPSDYQQSYFVTIPYDHKKEKCEYHWPLGD